MLAACAATVTAAQARFDGSACAVAHTCAVPALFALTRPEASTVATPVLSDVQITVFGVVPPTDTVAVSGFDSPTVKESVGGVTTIEFTCVTVTVALPDFDWSAFDVAVT